MGPTIEWGQKWAKTAFLLVVILTSTFHLYTAITGTLFSVHQRVIHLMLLSTLLFLKYPVTSKFKTNKRNVGIIDIFLIVITIASGIYLVTNLQSIVIRAGITTKTDTFFGILMIISVLEGVRRVIGWQLPLIGVSALLYGYFGQYMPMFLSHRGHSIERIVAHTYIFTEGIFGIPLGVSATFVYLFILFGSFLDQIGAGKLFINLAYQLVRNSRGGAAKTAVVASALTGTISGSVIANVVTTGTFTIPLMKRGGYPPHVAAAIEAVASSGGQIMPPIMGASAFIMADYLGIPFIQVAKAAIIPALLYFISIYFMVDLEAGRINIVQSNSKNVFKEEQEVDKPKLWEAGLLFTPIIILVATLIVGFTPMKAALYGIISCAIIGILLKRLTLNDFVIVFKKAGNNTIMVASATACAGIVIGMFSLTGLGLALSGIIVSFAGGSLLLLLVYAMIVSLILGMGLPTVACYILLAVLVSPALIKLGVHEISAHLFPFYFGIVSYITPPICVGAFAAAGLIGENPMKVGFTAIKFGLAAYIIPYIFAFEPALIMSGSFLNIIWRFMISIFGVYILSASIVGWVAGSHLKYTFRVILFGIAFTLLIPNMTTDIVGLLLILGIIGLGILSPINIKEKITKKGEK